MVAASRSAPVRLGSFVAITTLVVAVAAPIASATAGRDGVDCVLVAAAVCGLSGMVVLLVQEAFPDPRLALLHVAVGFLLRMGAPLAAGMALYWQIGRLAEAGFVFYLLAFYLLTLGVGTALSLPGKPLPRTEKS